MTAGGSLFRASMSFAWAEPVAASHVASGPPLPGGSCPITPISSSSWFSPGPLRGGRMLPTVPGRALWVSFLTPWALLSQLSTAGTLLRTEGSALPGPAGGNCNLKMGRAHIE